MKIFYLIYLSLLFAPLAMSQDLSSSPLPTCPDTPNCVHKGYSFQILSSDLADHVISVLKDMEAESIDVEQIDSHEIHAVFKVWKYKDDVHVAIIQEAGGALLYVRSASRKGHYDLGVNKRRVKRFLRGLNNALQAGQ